MILRRFLLSNLALLLTALDRQSKKYIYLLDQHLQFDGAKGLSPLVKEMAMELAVEGAIHGVNIAFLVAGFIAAFGLLLSLRVRDPKTKEQTTKI